MTNPPHGEEKFFYSNSQRGYVYCFAIVSSALLMAGNIAFVYNHPDFWIYSFFVALLLVYLLSTIAIGVFAKDFNIKEHMKVVRQNWPEASRASVDIFLPICGEDICILSNTWKHVAILAAAHDGPINVYVLDDGKSELARAVARSYKFNYITREDNHLKKAGNLRNAFAKTSGDFIIILDADFAPRSDFIITTVSHMIADKDIAIVQTPQFFRDKDQQSAVARGASEIQEFFYRMVQVSRDHFGAAICVGTNAVYRRLALSPFGGTAAITHSEDVHTGFECLKAGWKIKYIPINLAAGFCPSTWSSFFSQQYRWAMGSLSLCFSKKFWTAKITAWQRLSYLSGIFYYSSTGLGVLFYPMPTIYMLLNRPDMIKWFNLAFTIPSFIFFTVFMKAWMKQPYSIHLLEARLVSSFSHLFAMIDYALGSIEQWTPTGTKRKSSRFKTFVGAYTAYCLLIPSFILGSSIHYIMSGQSPYDFAILIPITLFNVAISIGPLAHIYAKEL